MCSFFMTTHVEKKNGERGLVKKPTGFTTISHCILEQLDRNCAGDRVHIPLVGGRHLVQLFTHELFARPLLRHCEAKVYRQKQASQYRQDGQSQCPKLGRLPLLVAGGEG